MEDYLFHESPVPPGYNLDFESSLFNTPHHLRLQSQDGWHSFFVLNEKYRIVTAAVHFHLNGEVASSPLKSPYGSVEFADDMPPLIVFRFLEFVESRLRAHGIKRIVIKDSPADYRPSQAALLHTFLFNLGYTAVNAEAGALLHVSDYKFEANLDDWEKRKLRQAAEARLVFKEIGHEQLGEIYIFILGCRKQKGHSLSMTLVELKETVRAFDKRYFLFGLFQNEKLVAASVSCRVREKVLYNFYSAHSLEFDSISPVVFLVDRMYKFCQDQHIGILDLGTSANDNKPNFGLLNFKLRLGARPTAKLTFEKMIVG